jgi:hypothetical protein
MILSMYFRQRQRRKEAERKKIAAGFGDGKRNGARVKLAIFPGVLLYKEAFIDTLWET